jgi:hypothetical protein
VHPSGGEPGRQPLSHSVGIGSNQQQGGAIEYRIDREALDEFIGRQVRLVESASIPKLLADVVELRLRHESVSLEEARALWLGAGLATHVGLAIFEEPERFVIAVPSPVKPAAAFAA